MRCATAEETPEQETEEKPAESFGAEGKEEAGTLVFLAAAALCSFLQMMGWSWCVEKGGDAEELGRGESSQV